MTEFVSVGSNLEMVQIEMKICTEMSTCFYQEEVT